MVRKRLYMAFCILSLLALSSCSQTAPPPSPPLPQDSVRDSSNGGESLSPEKLRDNTPHVLVPAADGDVVYGNDRVTLDASHLAEGYIMVRYSGSVSRIKIRIAYPSGEVYTYDVPDGFLAYPLSGGNGSYTVTVYENIVDDTYATAFSQVLDVALADEFHPFLYANYYVWFTEDSAIVGQAQSVADGSTSDLDVVSKVYHFVTDTVDYDRDKAASVQSGYIPDPDETLATGKGICFDYASLMCSMLRTQGIPTKLEVGYVGDVYHAWISTYVRDVGWIDSIIQFDGVSWRIMDPTFAANNDLDDIKEYIGDGSRYSIKYMY